MTPGDERGNGQWRVRGSLLAVAAVLVLAAFGVRDVAPDRLRSLLGLVCFLALLIACSTDIRAINWRTVAWGLGLQVLLAVLILKVEIGGVRPGYQLFSTLAVVVTGFLEFTNAGSEFVFGVLANPETMGAVFSNGLVLAFAALPIIIFISSFFTVLYHVGLLQAVVRAMARVMMPLMGTSGAETLSAAANVFMGQTEAPIIVKPYIATMTQSELLALMTGGLATIAGTMLGIYLNLGADPVGIMTTSVMAAPGSLCLAKILLPETERPVTAGNVTTIVGKDHVNVIDAAAAGATDGMRLAMNVAAMLIAFLAFIAMVDFGLGMISPGLSLARVFAVAFAPVALLLGTPTADVPIMADLLGTKLVTNEFVAYIRLGTDYAGVISERGHVIATFALTGFANLGSVGVILGGIGAMAPERRPDLARLSSRALLAGFFTTLMNAAIAACLI